MRSDLFTELLEAIATAPREDLPALLGQLREAEAFGQLRLQATPQTSPAANPERLLDITEAARRLNVSEDYLYRHWKRLPFARKCDWGLRFSESAIDDYIRSTH